MRTEIVINNGRVELVSPVYLKPDAPSHYYIDIPNEAIDNTRDWFPAEINQKDKLQKPKALKGSLQERYNNILGKLAKSRCGASIGDDHQMLQDALEERYFGR